MKRKLKVTVTRIKRTTGPAHAPAPETHSTDSKDVEKVIELIDSIRDEDARLQILNTPKPEKQP